jgi:hypothetical protein
MVMTGVSFQINIGKEADALLARLQDRAGALAAMAKAMDIENQITVRDIHRLYLSFPSNGPTSPIGCRAVTQQLRSSLHHSAARVTGDTITGSIGSALDYAAVQEFGATINRTVKAGTVKLRTTASGALLRQAGGRLAVFAGAQHSRFRETPIKESKVGKKYQIKIEGRGFVQRGIRDRQGDLATAMRAALVEFLGGAA